MGCRLFTEANPRRMLYNLRCGGGLRLIARKCGGAWALRYPGSRCVTEIRKAGRERCDSLSTTLRTAASPTARRVSARKNERFPHVLLPSDGRSASHVLQSIHFTCSPDETLSNPRCCSGSIGRRLREKRRTPASCVRAARY